MRRLSEIGAKIYRLYSEVEGVLSFAARREREVAWNLAWALDPLEACEAARALEEAVNGRVACVAGPLAAGLAGCEAVVAAGEAGLNAAAGLGVRPVAVASDLDGRPVVAGHGAWLLIAHVHADNLHLAAGSLRGGWAALLTAQAPVPGWVLSPFGFADGDRAALAAAGLGAGRLVVEGLDLEPPSPKFRLSIKYLEAGLEEAGFRARRLGRYRLVAEPL